MVVVGSGTSGLTAALAASSAGAAVAVLEKGKKFGGSSALSGGQLWIPNNRFQKRAGIKDSPSMASKYLTKLARGRVDPRLIESFVENSPKALDFVLQKTPLRPALRENEPDYHPEWDGALKGGRTIDPGLFEGDSLGEEYASILHNQQYHLPGGLHTTSLEFEMLMRGEEVPGLEGRNPRMLALGEALVGGLRKGLMDEGVPLFLSHRAIRLVFDGRGVSGVEVRTSRRPTSCFVSSAAVCPTPGNVTRPTSGSHLSETVDSGSKDPVASRASEEKDVTTKGAKPLDRSSCLADGDRVEVNGWDEIERRHNAWCLRAHDLARCRAGRTARAGRGE